MNSDTNTCIQTALYRIFYIHRPVEIIPCQRVVQSQVAKGDLSCYRPCSNLNDIAFTSYWPATGNNDQTGRVNLTGQINTLARQVRCLYDLPEMGVTVSIEWPSWLMSYTSGWRGDNWSDKQYKATVMLLSCGDK